MKISIITVSYNSEKTIKETFESIINQTYNNIEYIVVDGNSNDNTIDIIREYEKKFNGRLRYISEKDKGIYDAMNKGIKMATGDIIGILNSDDILANKEVIKRIVEEFINTNCDAIYSDLLFLDADTMKIPTRNFIAKRQSKKFGWHPPHPTLYLKRKVYEEVGNYDVNYRIAADYDFMLRMLNGTYLISYINEYLVYMRSGGVSTNGLKGYMKNFKEAQIVLKKNHVFCPSLCNTSRILKTFNQAINAKISKNKILNKM